jgi:hypothetical protein
MGAVRDVPLTQHKTHVPLETRVHLGLLDRPGADVGEYLVAHGGLLGRAGDGPPGLGDLLEELLDKRGGEAGGLRESQRGSRGSGGKGRSRDSNQARKESWSMARSPPSRE